MAHENNQLIKWLMPILRKRVTTMYENTTDNLPKLDVLNALANDMETADADVNMEEADMGQQGPSLKVLGRSRFVGSERLGLMKGSWKQDNFFLTGDEMSTTTDEEVALEASKRSQVLANTSRKIKKVRKRRVIRKTSLKTSQKFAARRIELLTMHRKKVEHWLRDSHNCDAMDLLTHSIETTHIGNGDQAKPD